MKLYNIYKTLILEGTKDTIIQAINDKVAVRIWYRAPNQPLEERYGFIYGMGTTKGDTSGGNEAIRFFQAYGGTKSGNGKWKTLRLDRISKIELTKFKFHKPVDKVSGGESIPSFKGQQDKSMTGDNLTNHVKF
jgi:hypothetical protein